MLEYSERVEKESIKRLETYIGSSVINRNGSNYASSILSCKNNIIRFVINREYVNRGGRCDCDVCKRDIGTDGDTWENPEKQRLFLLSIGYEMVKPSKTIMKLIYFKTKDGYIGCNSIYCIMRAIEGKYDFDLGIFKSKNEYQIQNLLRYIEENRKNYKLLNTHKNIRSKETCFFKYTGDGLSKNSCRYFKMTLDRFLHAECKHPNLIMSKGEKRISDWMAENNIKYKTNYVFDDCRNERPLKFDFGVFKNGKLFGVIEFDGAQHEAEYGFVDAGKLEYRKNNDRIKTDYCKNNRINFLRINHRDYKNIPAILENWNRQISTMSKETIDQIIKLKIELIKLKQNGQ